MTKRVKSQITTRSKKSKSVHQIPLLSLLNTSSVTKFFDSRNLEFFIDIEKNEFKRHDNLLQLGVVCPILPNICELLFLNKLSRNMTYKSKIFTSVHEEKYYKTFIDFCELNHIDVFFEVEYFKSVNENKTFLSGIENAINHENLVLCFGEDNLSTYQIIKLRQKLNHSDSFKNFKIVLWQNSPRPPEASLHSTNLNGSLLPRFAREKTLRKEALKKCDSLVCLDKDSGNWAFLEGAEPNKIKRINRSISSQLFLKEKRDNLRSILRNKFKIPENEFIFFHLGPNEMSSGCIDTLYGFKTLLCQINLPVHNVKLIYLDLGSSTSTLKKTVLDLDLDAHVYFVKPLHEGDSKSFTNKILELLPIADGVIHNPLIPYNNQSQMSIDMTYEVLISASYGMPVCSNGTGWIGDWCKRFFPTFSSGNPFSLSKCLTEFINKKQKINVMVSNAYKAICNEMDIDRNAQYFYVYLIDILSKSNVLTENLPELDLLTIESKIKSQDYESAIKLIEKSFSNKSLTLNNQSKLYRCVGDIFTKLGDLDSGLENYLTSLKCDPCCSKAYIGLGTIALQQNNPQAAIPQFHKAIGLSPHDDMAYLGLGLAYIQIGDKQSALNWCGLACEQNHLNEISIYHLVQLSFELKSYSVAIKALTAHLIAKPESLNMRYSLAGLLYKSGDLDASLHHLNLIIQQDPSHTSSLTLMSKIYKENKAKHKTPQTKRFQRERA